MATISSIGVGSGLDATAIIDALLQIERQPIQTLATQAKALDAQLSSFGKIQSYLDTLQTAASKLKSSSTWTATTATSSNSSAVTVSVGAGTSPGAYSVQVSKLAAAQMVASPAAASAATSIGQGTLSIQLGSWNDSVDTFTPKDGSASIDIEIGPDEDTLEGIRDKINNTEGVGVKATIVNDAGGARLVLQSSSTGATNGFRVQVSGDTDGVDDDDQGLSQLSFDPETFAPAATRPQAAQNAMATINNLPVESETNTLSEVIDGVTLKLSATTTSAVDINVASDNDSMRSAVDSFVTAYNAIVGLLRDQTKYDAGSKSAGTLQGDRTAITLQNQLRSLLGTNSSASSVFTRASDIGLDVQKDGTIKTDSSKLTAAIANRDELQKFFAADGGTAATDGLARRMQELTDSWTSFDGALTNRTDGLTNSKKRNSDRQAEMQTRVDATEARLRAQYSALDTRMAQLSSLQSYVSQQAANWSNG